MDDRCARHGTIRHRIGSRGCAICLFAPRLGKDEMVASAGNHSGPRESFLITGLTQNGAASRRGKQSTGSTIPLPVVITRCGPTRLSGERAKLVFGWLCRNRAPRVGCGRTPRSLKSRSQIAGDPAFRGAPSVAVLPRHALRNVAENLVGRAVGQTSMFKGIDAQTITGS